jgi:hypothetical protein
VKFGRHVPSLGEIRLGVNNYFLTTTKKSR